MPEFFQTRMGQKFYEGTIPTLVAVLKDIANELKRANDIKEKQKEEEG